MIAQCPCTPPSTLVKKQRAEACSSKELRDTKIVKSRVSGFSRAKLEAGRNELCVQIGISLYKSCFCVFSRPS